MVLPIMENSIGNAGHQITLRNVSVLPAILIAAFIPLTFTIKPKF
jgi:hypothetical protein